MIAAMISAISIGTLCICASGQEADTTEPVITDNIHTETSPAVSASTSPSESETTVIQTDSETSETTAASEPQIENGWNFINNRWFYYSDGIPASGTVEIDGENYLFAPNDVLQTGWQTVNKKKYYFGSDSKMVTGLVKIDGEQYYFNDKGAMQTGFQKIGSNTYYFSST